jgi:DNA-binding SARP family transcriptional activator
VLEIRLCGGLEVVVDGDPISDAPLAGKQGRLAFGFLVANRDRLITRDELAELLWAERLPESWSASLSAVISRVRKQLSEAGLDGATALANVGDGYELTLPHDVVVDWELALTAIDDAEIALAKGDVSAAIEAAATAARLAAKGFLAEGGAWVDKQRSAAQDVCVRAALVTAEGHLANGAANRAVEAARSAVAIDELREAGYRLLMRALDASGERAQALRAWERCRVLLADELGVDPSPETEAVYLEILSGASGEAAKAKEQSLPSGVVTFLLTDIVESSALWEKEPTAMAAALERHDALAAEVVAAAGGTLLKSKLEGDATVSVFARATAGSLAAIALRAAIADEEWPAGAAPTVRMALHTGEAFERAGDYFGPALNRAARVRGLAGAGQILLTQAIAELVRDHLPEDAALVDLGYHDLRGLSRGENLFEVVAAADAPLPEVAPLEQPPLPAPLATAGPFVGRGDELAGLWSRWSAIAESGGAHAMLIAGEPGVGKSRLAAECARLAHADGGIVVYGRCDEELGAALQPFVEAIRGLTPALGRERLRRVRGINEVGRLVPEISEQLPTGAIASSADPDTERQALFDAITELLVVASKDAPLLLVLDDLHWAGKTTLSLLRHLLRNAGDARLLVIGTYRDTELGRTHPLAATIADLRRDRAADRVSLEGLAAAEVAAYLAAIGNDDAALSRELAEVTSGNPFFLIEALRHVEESGGVWEPGSLPEGVREATGRRLSHLSDAANDALTVAAVAGTTFELGLIEKVRSADLVDEISEAVRAGLVFEDSHTLGTFRFAHALVRQVLLAELVTLKRLRLHQAIAELLEEDDASSDARLADLAYHWFECASAGNAAKAVEACRRAADHAMERLAYEEAGDLYRMAIEAAESIEATDDMAALHLARCDVLVTAGDVPAARAAIDALGAAVRGDARLAALHTIYAGQLAVLTDTEALPRFVDSIAAAAQTLHDAGDTNGEAKAHYVHALTLERLGQIGAAERALVSAIDAARTAGDQRLADAILAETPPVVLWGPIPVTRASGRCLDVVRVLRITSGAPAVESVALRCQAVLEALRGRIDAARRMIASAHRKVDEVGLVLRRLETETSAGFIELLGGDAAEAERILRSAYGELRSRGLDSEAALAAALLGRALLSLGRDDEAETAAQDAERLAGADLYPAVIWRDVRAMAALNRGELQLARQLADDAVGLVAATDALLVVADARRTLAAVMRGMGDPAGAAVQEQLAIEAAEAKGATVLVARVGSTDTASAAAPTTVESPWSNLATRALEGFLAAWNAGDWDGVLARVWTDSDDRRDTIRLVSEGDDVIATLRMVFELGVHWTVELRATRGDRLALVRGRVEHVGDDAFDNEYLMIVECDEQGALQTTIGFALDAVHDAYTHLDERFVAQDPRNAQFHYAKFNERDWEGFGDGFEPVVRVVDNRPLRFFVAGNRDELVAIYRSNAELAPDSRMFLDHIVVTRAGDGDVALLSNRMVGSSDGAVFEKSAFLVARAEQGRAAELEFFDDTEYTAARARYDEIAASLTTSTPEARWGNAAWRLAQRLREAWERGDWDTIVALSRATDDRTRAARLQMDLDSVLDGIRLSLDLGTKLFMDLLATRGDNLALIRLRLEGSTVGGGAFENAFISLYEVDTEGEQVRSVIFDGDALDDALRLLDERFLEHDARNATFLLPNKFNERNWVAFASGLHPDLRIADHRSNRLLEARDSAELVAWQKSILEFAPDARLRIDHIRLDWESQTVGAGLLELGLVGTSGGGPFENPTLIVSAARDGQAIVLEYFDHADFDAAVARYNELGGDKPESHWSNAAWQSLEAFERAWAAGDLEGALRVSAPRIEDRMSHSRVSMERDDVIDSLRFQFEAGNAYRVQLIATRGERLAVARLTTVSPGFEDRGPYEAGYLLAVEVDSEGAPLPAAMFDPTATEDAYVYLDERFIAEDPRNRQYLMPKTYNDRDWDAFIATAAEDLEIVDRRSSRLVTARNRDELLATYKASAALAPDSRMVIDHARHIRAADGSGVVFGAMRMYGTNEGGPFETAALVVFEGNSQLRAQRMEYFDSDDFEGAQARFQEMAASLDANDPFENTAARTGRRVMNAVMARDWATVSAAVNTEAYVIDDRRGFSRVAMPGIDSIQSLVGADKIEMAAEVLATRGDRLALSRTSLTTVFDDGERSDGSALVVMGVDESGLLVLNAVFDLDERASATSYLDDRFAEEVGGEPELLALARMYNERDWDGLRRVGASSLRTLDHRPLGLGSNAGNEAFAMARAGVELAPGSRYVVDHLRYERTTRGSTSMADWRVLGGDTDDWQYESHALVVARGDSNRQLDVLEYFAAGDLAAAQARFEELVAGPDFGAVNRASERVAEFGVALRTRNLQAIAAVLAPEHIYEERRGFVQRETPGLEFLQPFLNLDEAQWHFELLATRGERLALTKVRIVLRDGHSGESEGGALTIHELNEHDQLSRAVLFEPDAFDAAFDELDARYVAQGGADYGGLRRAHARRDWDAFARSYEPDATIIDHRRGGWGRDVPIERIIEVHAATAALAEDTRIHTRHEIARSGRVGLLEQAQVGSREGGAFELPHYTVFVANEQGRVSRFELFDVEDFDAAQACFDELASEPA